ncbi:unnamed protein product, partial [Closterium sp. NIES-53]
DAWHVEFGDKADHPRWVELHGYGVAIIDLDYDAILAFMHALSVSTKGDFYVCVPPDPGIEAAALGASESSLPRTAPAQALHTFTLDSGASRCFFHESTTLTPLSAPVPIRQADTSRGPVLARSSTVLPCPAVPSGSLLGLHLPSFSMNLVSTAALQDAMVTSTTPEGQHVSICTCTQTGRHLATFTRRPGSSLYTLATEPTQVAASAHVSASGPVAPPFSCRLLSHQTLLRHHHLGHPSPPRLCGMQSRLLVSGLPRSLPPLTSLPAPPCLPCVEGQQHAAPHSSLFPQKTASLQTLHMDVWGLACWCNGLHSDRSGEFSSDLLRDFCCGEGITHSFTLPASPQQNGVVECRISLVMEVTRTFMIHAAAPHFLWPFAVRYPAHELNLWPRVSLPETSPTLHWTGKVGDALVFRFYHPTSRRVLSSQDVTFDESVPFYRVSHVDRVEPVEVAVDSGTVGVGAASGGAEPAGAGPGGTEPERAEPEVAESGGAEPRGAEPEHTEPGGAELGSAEPERTEPGGPLSTGGPLVALSWWETLSPPQLREWFVRRTRHRSGAAGAGRSATGGTRAPDPLGSGAFRVGGTGAGAAGDAGAAGPGGARPGGTGAARAGVAACVGAGNPGAGDTGAGGASAGGAGTVGDGFGDTGRPRPYFIPLLQQILGLPTSPDPSPLPAPSLYTEHTRGLTEPREPVSRPALPVCAVRTGRRVPHPCPPRVPCLLATVVTDPSFECAAASTLVVEVVDFSAACRLDYAASLVAQSESHYPPFVGGECALGTDVLEDRQEDLECFAAAVPHLVSMLIAPEGDPDTPDIPTPRSYAEAITIPPPGANIVDGMWIFTVKRPPGSPPVFKACYVAQCFSQRQGGSLHKEIWLRRPPGFTGSFPAGTQWSLRRPVYGLRQAPCKWHDTLRTTLAALGFAPSTADPLLFLRTDCSLPPFYILMYVDDLVFATADTEALALVKSEVQKRHTCTDLGELRSYLGLQITRDRARHTITLTQSHMVHQVLQRFGFRYSSPQSTPVPTGHSLSAPPSDLPVEPSGLTSGMGLVLGGRGDVVLTGHADASWVDDLATQRSSQGYTFSLGSVSISWRSTCSSSDLSSSCEVEIYAGAMAVQELRWLTYLLTDLGERPRSSPNLYVNNKAMIALCQEHRLEQRTKHIALRYFLARELQQRGQLRLTYVATRANSADIFTMALDSGDYQRFCTVLGLVPTLPHLLTA